MTHGRPGGVVAEFLNDGASRGRCGELPTLRGVRKTHREQDKSLLTENFCITSPSSFFVASRTEGRVIVLE
jgi:hypothetical protein